MSHTLLPALPDTLDLYIAQIKQFQVLSREEELQLTTDYRREGSIDAAHRLICANLRFVVKIAHEYRGYGLKLLDLIQEGNIGLMMALKKFEPDRGLRFITYAVWWIRAFIHNFIIHNWSLVKIGTTQAQKKLFFKLGQAREALRRMTGTAPPSEIARQLQVSDQEVEEMSRRMAGHDASLDVELVEGEGYSLLDTLADGRADQEQLLLQKEELRLTEKRVRKAMQGLNERERHIVKDRILSDQPRTLQELADDYGISRERIRQVEKNALEKIRRALVRDADQEDRKRPEKSRAAALAH
jgi:RNA polymerase sigma-32 factor